MKLAPQLTISGFYIATVILLQLIAMQARYTYYQYG
jgi:hypothetical protein